MHVSADSGPYGRQRDDAVERALDAVPAGTGSPYAVTPGRVTKGDGTPFKVFTPFARAWPGTAGARLPVRPTPSRGAPASARTTRPRHPGWTADLHRPGGRRARCLAAVPRRWLPDYDAARNTPAVDGTSRMSAYLKFGCIHPARCWPTSPGTRGAGDSRRAGLAGVLRRRPLAPAGLGPEYLEPAVHGMDRRRPPTPSAGRGLEGRAAPDSRSSTPACANAR